VSRRGRHDGQQGQQSDEAHAVPHDCPLPGQTGLFDFLCP
jgi:hypothetical protein